MPLMDLLCRLLPYDLANGPANMAADEVLLRAAANGQASLRFYGWTEATLSLGYFQPAARRLGDPLLRDLPFVRRPSGGDALVHHHELTYCLAVPSQQARQTDLWLAMHAVIPAALAGFGIDARPPVLSGGDSFSGFLCFEHFTAGDLIVNGAKVVGSAQRRQRNAVMQHGGILLAQSRFTPSLPGIRELSVIDVDVALLRNAIVKHLKRRTGWRIEPGDLTAEETRACGELVIGRYANETWNHKR
jgi:lipoyl(octanoyl) transferase